MIICLLPIYIYLFMDASISLECTKVKLLILNNSGIYTGLYKRCCFTSRTPFTWTVNTKTIYLFPPSEVIDHFYSKCDIPSKITNGKILLVHLCQWLNI